MKRTQHTSVRMPRVEKLESRFLLAPAVGGFFPDPQGAMLADAESESYAQGGGGPYVVQDELDGDSILAHANTAAISTDEDGFAVMIDDREAVVLGPATPNFGISTPTTSASGISELTCTGFAHAGMDTRAASALGQYIYVPDPVINLNLQAFGHLSIIAGGLDVGDAGGGTRVHSDIDGYYIDADDRDGDRVWEVTTDISGIVLPTESVGGVNIHVRIPIEIPQVLSSEVQGWTSGLSQGGLAMMSQSMSAASWAYVLGPDDAITPGDFNYDGNVNQADYELWANGSLQADVTPVATYGDAVVYDGIVDAQDYAVWAEHANAILVTTANDVVDANDGYLSLREAITLAGDPNHPGTDVIAFNSDVIGHTINLTLGALNINYLNPVKILGPGADELTISGNNATINVFNVTGNGATPLESTISHLTITGTSTNGTGVAHSDSTGTHDLILDSLVISGNGWGVKHGSSSQTTIRSSTISNNYWDGVARVSQSPPQDYASVTIVDCDIVNNGVNGVSLKNLDVSISGTEIAGNNTRGLGGKGIYFHSDEDNPGVTLTITNSTIAENHGQGIDLGSETISNISNTTVSSNSGLGVSVSNGGTATLTNVTVTQNSVATAGATAGVYAGTGSTITMFNTIVAENYSGPQGSQVVVDLGRYTGAPAGYFAIGTTSYNLIGEVGNSGVTSSFNNIIIGSNIAGLTMLGDYGGRTRTHALLLTSLAVDAGDDSRATAFGLLYDQRGDGFDRIVDDEPPTESGFDIDIGAFEVAFADSSA